MCIVGLLLIFIQLSLQISYSGTQMHLANLGMEEFVELAGLLVSGDANFWKHVISALSFKNSLQ